MAITKPPVLPAWAESGDRVTPSNAEIQIGWPLSSIPPSRQRFNWLLNFLANGVRYFTRRGLPDYDAAETYMTGDRIIGDDGKTYRSLIDANIAQTPSTSPTKWERWALTLAEMYTSFVTPAQFDNSVKPATTAFVQRALGNFSGRIQANTTQTLPASVVGSVININGSNPTVTLPLVGSVPSGSVIVIESVTPCTIVRQGSDVFYGSKLSSASIQMLEYDSLVLEANGFTGWTVIGGSAQLQGVTGFVASTAANGYQKLPTGVIIQWGTFTSSGTANAAVAVTFPITFPNSVRSLSLAADYSVASQSSAWSDSVNNIGFNGRCNTSGNTVRWTAIGY